VGIAYDPRDKYATFKSFDAKFCRDNISKAPCNIFALIREMLEKQDNLQTEIDELKSIVHALIGGE